MAIVTLMAWLEQAHAIYYLPFNVIKIYVKMTCITWGVRVILL